MQKIISVGFFGALVGALLSVPTFALAQNNTERIDGFYMSAHINADGTVGIKERIVYNFGDNEKHGIFRTIPVKYQTSIGTLKTRISDITVTDEQFNEIPYDVSNRGNNLEIKIGDADVLVNGVKTYVIGYTIEKTIGYFESYDEWYWNITGNDWQVPIGEVEAMIHLPKGIPGNDLRVSCYVGVRGSNNVCGKISTSTDEFVQSITFKSSGILEPYEGITGVVGFPKGIIHQPTQKEKLIEIVKNNWILGLPLVVFGFMFYIWWRKGKDPAGRGTVVAEYDAPEKITPMEMSFLRSQSVQNNAITAHIIYLAEMGYLTITQSGEKKFLKDNTDYILTKKRNASEAENEVDQVLLNSLFDNDTKTEQKLSDFKNTFYAKLSSIKKPVSAAMIAKGYYPEDPQKTIMRYAWIAIILFIGLWIAGGLMGLVGAISLGVSAVIILLFSFIMPRVTLAGAVMKERIEGLKRYIEVAEKDRINFHNAPEKKPELFEKLLPFAMVLGAEKAWAKQFEGIYTTQPSWYNGTTGNMFSAMILADSLSSFNTVATSSLTSAPSGGSGSGGGGFSGGGFGGGGGGSW